MSLWRWKSDQERDLNLFSSRQISVFFPDFPWSKRRKAGRFSWKKAVIGFAFMCEAKPLKRPLFSQEDPCALKNRKKCENPNVGNNHMRQPSVFQTEEIFFKNISLQLCVQPAALKSPDARVYFSKFILTWYFLSTNLCFCIYMFNEVVKLGLKLHLIQNNFHNRIKFGCIGWRVRLFYRKIKTQLMPPRCHKWVHLELFFSNRQIRVSPFKPGVISKTANG